MNPYKALMYFAASLTTREIPIAFGASQPASPAAELVEEFCRKHGIAALAPGESSSVLDHGFVRYIDHMGGDLSITRSARVSYAADWLAGNDTGSDARLIRFLLMNGHTSPFESCAVTFEVKAPIFVVRQWHRHRTQSYNEVSARYTALPGEFYLPEPNKIGKQSKDNKQARDFVSDEENEDAENMVQIMFENNTEAFDAYRKLLDQGAPRELARSVLPVGTYTRMFATANLLNWMRFLKERLHPHAQYEIRVYAEAVADFLDELYPVAMATFREKYKDRIGGGS